MRPYRRLFVVVGAALVLPGVAGCDDKAAPAPAATKEMPQTVLGKSAKMGRDLKGAIEAQQMNTAAMADVMQGGKQATIAGLNWTEPEGWESVKPSSQMRVAEYRVQTDAGSVSVVFFTTGGDAGSNIVRWSGQMKGPGGGAVIPITRKLSFPNGVTATLVSMEGTYSGMGPNAQPLPPQDGVKFLGAIVEGGPSGQVQIRATGTLAAVEAMEKAFNGMIASVQKP
ncbi:MAG: hypothetical protein ACKVS8_08615 [Phycisphaerales bacterium]